MAKSTINAVIQFVSKGRQNVSGDSKKIEDSVRSVSDVVDSLNKKIKAIGVAGAKMVKERAKNFPGNIRLEYSPESYTGTEPEYALEVVNAVLDVWQPTKDDKTIINLP